VAQIATIPFLYQSGFTNTAKNKTAYSKNKTPVLRNAIPVLGEKLKGE